MSEIIESGFHCTAENIRCRADRQGATIHEIQTGGKIVKVLAHDERSATEAASFYEANKENDL